MTENMVPEGVDELTEFLREHLGSDLQRVAYYSRDGGEYCYLREDLDRRLAEEDLAELLDDVRIDAFARPQQENVYRSGDLHALVRVFEDAYQINIVLSDTEGVALSVDPVPGADLPGLIARSVEILDG